MEQSSLNPKRIANTPRIYVASLSDYNAGRLLGRWIDADQPAEAIHEQIAQLLAESNQPIAGPMGAGFGARPLF
jgi:hypothetical protein